MTSQGQMLKFRSWERRKSGLGHPKDEKKLGPIESWGGAHYVKVICPTICKCKITPYKKYKEN